MPLLLYLVFVISSLCFASTSAILDGLLPNGNFDEAPSSSNLVKGVIQGKNSLPKWEINRSVSYITSEKYFRPSHGNHSVLLGFGASICQTIEVLPGSIYSLTFAVTKTCNQNEVLRVSVPPVARDIPLQNLYSNISSGGDMYAWAFKATTTVAKILFQNRGVRKHPACFPLIDSIAIKEVARPRSTRANMARNGDFEDGPYLLEKYTDGVLLLPNQYVASPIPGWIIGSPKAVKYIDSTNFQVISKKRSIELISGKEGVISQILRTVPGTSYTLSLEVADARNFCQGRLIVQVFAGNASMQVSTDSFGGGGRFTIASLDFKANETRTEIKFYSLSYQMKSYDNVDIPCGPVLDYIYVTALP